MGTPENVQFVRLCLFPRVHFLSTVYKSNVSFSRVQFTDPMGQMRVH